MGAMNSIIQDVWTNIVLNKLFRPSGLDEQKFFALGSWLTHFICFWGYNGEL